MIDNNCSVESAQLRFCIHQPFYFIILKVLFNVKRGFILFQLKYQNLERKSSFAKIYINTFCSISEMYTLREHFI